MHTNAGILRFPKRMKIVRFVIEPSEDHSPAHHSRRKALFTPIEARQKRRRTRYAGKALIRQHSL